MRPKEYHFWADFPARSSYKKCRLYRRIFDKEEQFQVFGDKPVSRSRLHGNSCLAKTKI